MSKCKIIEHKIVRLDKVEIKKNAVYTTEEVAEILILSRQTIQKYVRGKKLKAVLIGGKWYRIRGQAIFDFLNKNKAG